LSHPQRSGFQPVSRPQEGREQLLEALRVDILCTQLSYICFILVLSGSRWIRVGYYNGSRYKIGWKPLVSVIQVLALPLKML